MLLSDLFWFWFVLETSRKKSEQIGTDRGIPENKVLRAWANQRMSEKRTFLPTTHKMITEPNFTIFELFSV